MTLLKTESDECRVYGMGFKISDDKKAEVLNHLDYREKNGYDRYETTFYPLDGSPPSSTIVYVANEENCSFNPNHDLSDIARQVFESKGPSGPNVEYVYNLCDAMRKHFADVDDEHLFTLEMLLRKMEAET